MFEGFNGKTEDPTALIALMDAGASEAELLDAYMNWMVTRKHMLVVVRLYHLVSDGFQETILAHLMTHAVALGASGVELSENGWVKVAALLVSEYGHDGSCEDLITEKGFVSALQPAIEKLDIRTGSVPVRSMGHEQVGCEIPASLVRGEAGDLRYSIYCEDGIGYVSVVRHEDVYRVLVSISRFS